MDGLGFSSQELCFSGPALTLSYSQHEEDGFWSFTVSAHRAGSPLSFVGHATAFAYDI